jgi:hypothetical protein
MKDQFVDDRPFAAKFDKAVSSSQWNFCLLRRKAIGWLIAAFNISWPS